MISATALNASTVPLNKSPQMPLGLDNSRLRVDSQKFLVPSLPVSSRQINPRTDPHHHQQPSPHHHHQHNPHSLHYQQHNGGGAVEAGNKRRSIHPISPVENRGMSASAAHHNHLNGNYTHQHRRSSSPLGLNGKGTSPNYNHAYMQSSPRKDAHSPMYAGEVPGYSESPGGGSTFSARSSVPIPCSSPSPGTSASPKSAGASSSHSLSPSSQSGYPPHLPPSANGASELSQLAVAAAAAAAAASGNHRLYPPGFPPPSAAAAHHAAYLAAAAAAAGHSLPYPSLFGSPHYPPSHQHPHGSSAAAAASSYLDFHSKLLRNSAAAVAAVAASADIRSPSQSPPSNRSSSGSYQSNSSPQQQHHNHNILQPMGSPQSTSVTSLHTKLIESVSAAGDRYHPHHNSSSHNHVNNQTRFSSSSSSSSSSTSPSNGVSKGGPLGISGGIMGLTISPNSNTNSPHKGHSGPVATSATPEMSSKSTTKLYMEHPGLPGNNIGNRNSNSESQERKLLAEMELINGRDSKATKEAIMLAKQRMLTRSPENYSTSSGRHHHLINQQHQHHHSSSQDQKSTANVKSISFASDAHSGGIHRQPYINGHASSHPHPHQHHHSLHSHQHSGGGGPTNLSTDPKKSSSTNQVAASNFHQQNHMFLPPSPKKRSAPCNFAVPQSPSSSGGKVVDLLPPPPPPSDSHFSDRESSSTANLQHNISPSSKYLSPNQHQHHQQQQHHHHHPQSQHQHQKPSNGGPDARAAASSSAGLADGSHHPHHHPQHHQNYHSSSSNAQQLLVVPNSPLSTNSSSSSHGGSGPSTPKSPSVHFRFFGGAQNKENSVVATGSPGRNGRILNARNDSSSSTSSTELGANGRGRQSIGGTNGGGPWPVEQMPLISAFRKGSLIKLASGDLKAVEEMREEDFEKAVMMTNSVRIVYCHVIAIQPIPDSQLCKVTLAMGAAQNQQVVVEASPEQPFFIRGRGWSSSSPKLTEKLLQLPCSTLAVGDICITLTRHISKAQTNSTSSTPGGRGGKANKSGVARPYGTYAKSRNASTTSILKSSHQAQSQRGGIRMTAAAARKLVSGPSTPTATTAPAVVGATATVTAPSSGATANVDSAAGINNQVTPTPIIRQTEKILSPPSSSSASAMEVDSSEKEMDLSVAKTRSTENSNSDNIQDSNKTTSLSLSPASSALAHKRKSISPGPFGIVGRSKTIDVDHVPSNDMRPPSPKKRRWSAPEQTDMEIEAQQKQNNNNSLPSSSSSSEKQGTSSNSVEAVNFTRVNENKEVASKAGSHNENSKDSTDVSIKSEVVKSTDIPPEKA